MNQNNFSPEERNKGLEFYYKGVSLDAEGRTEEAIGEYREALERCPDLAEAHYNLGVDLATQGNVEQAIRSWKRAVWLNQDFQHELIKALDLEHECREDEISPSFHIRLNSLQVLPKFCK